VKAVRVRKARRHSSCRLCQASITTGQQVADDGRGWMHVQCLIRDREKGSEMTNPGIVKPQVYSYGEVGHDPPVHMVAGTWIGPKEVRRSQAQNQSLCGKKLSRFRGRPSDDDLLCGSCRRVSEGSGGMETQISPELSAQMESLNNVSDQDYEVHFVPLGQLIVDMSDVGGGRLQRTEQHSWARKLAADWSWPRYNRRPAMVSARADGTYHVVDGQHSVAAMRLAGYDPETAVRCHVYRGLSREQEAAMFREENADRKSVKPIDLFRARLAEGDPVAVSIGSLIQAFGWEIAPAGVTGHFAAVKTFESVYKSKDGPQICHKVLDTITTAWDRDPDGVHQTVIKVLSMFWRRHPDADVSRLAHVLHRESELQPVRIHGWTHDVAWQETAVVRLRERYNNRLDPSRRLEP
jgi:hypothetical protein